MIMQKNWAQEAWKMTVEKVTRTSTRIRDRFPHASVDGVYQLEKASWWTAGFSGRWIIMVSLPGDEGYNVEGIRGFVRNAAGSGDRGLL